MEFKPSDMIIHKSDNEMILLEIVNTVSYNHYDVFVVNAIGRHLHDKVGRIVYGYCLGYGSHRKYKIAKWYKSPLYKALTKNA